MTMPFSPMGRLPVIKTASRFLKASVVIVVLSLMPFASTYAQIRLLEVAGGFSGAVYVTAPIGDNFLYVVEKAGTIETYNRSTAGRSEFFNIVDKVDANGERGLLGLAFDPNFSTNRRFYVNYIDKSLNTVVERYTVGANGSVDLNAGTRILSVAQPAGLNNHKAGWIGFRPGENNNLYIATGDGGGGNDPGNNGQNLNSNLGKILRVDVSSDAFPSDPNRNYSIPTSNPYASGGGNAEIWAYGLRNPWRNSFDRQTGDLYIGDVGQGTREEINREAASSAGGVNYGWRVREGMIATPNVGGPKTSGMVDPIYDYPQNGIQASVTGGYVYRGPVSFMQGMYFFGDFMRGEIWSFRPNASGGITELTNWTPTLTQGGMTIGNLSSFGEDAVGNLYVVDFSGRVMLLVPEPSTYALFGLGLIGIGALSRYRRQAKGHAL